MTKLKLIDHVKMMDRATCMAFAKVGEMHPLYHITDRNGDEHVMPAPPIQKHVATELVRQILRDMGATRVVMIDEAWMVSGGPETETLVNQCGSVENTPGRIEVIFYWAEDDVEGTMSAQRQITRDNDGAPTLGPLEIKTDNQFSGNMTGLLPNTGSTH